QKPYNGFIVGFYVLAYGVMRFVIDYYRMPISAPDFALRLVDNGVPVHFVQTPLNLIPSQFYSLAMIVGGILFLVVAKRLHDRRASARPNGSERGTEKSRSMRKLRKKIR
ncbi:MAG: hypothetical protein GVY29_10810, partial [Spirochaetes bacterium]|nr:hypothetical protein [Spirochaetota bacterium]